MGDAEFRIRPAESRDARPLAALVLSLMEHLGDPPEGFDQARFGDDAFGAEPQFGVLVADADGALIGYALFHDAYEPSFAARGVYLSDLHVCPAMRRHGVGRALLSAVAADAARRRRTFIWWVARSDEARAFYRTLANVEQSVTVHAVTVSAFDRLLATPPT
jgi:GNAT superfamily N-acetyltransferase